MGTLFEFEEISAKILIGNRLHAVINGDKIDIYKNDVFIESKPISKDFEKRLTVVELVNNYGAMKLRIAELLEVSRQSIDNWLDSYTKNGAVGLINNTKDSWKKNSKRFTGNKARELENDRFQESQKQESLEITIDFKADADDLEEVKTDLYTDTYGLENNRYAGTMLVIGMLEHLYNFSSLSASVYNGHADFIHLFMAMHINQISSVEQLKVVHKHEFGRIIGKNKLESMPMLWTDIHQGVDQRKSNELHDKVFNYQCVKGLVGLENLFVDGHFIPYYGNEKTHKGFYTQRDLMIKGQTQMFVHDKSGRVVYFETQEGKGDIVKALKKTSEYISRLNEGIKPLITVDREVWGVENFIYLKDERIVTWEKFSNQDELQQIDIALFTDEIYKNQRHWQLFEDKKEYRDKDKNLIVLRRVVMHNESIDRRLCVVTTDNSEDKKIIADAMLSRWGSNENTFKFMGERTNMHYNPTIEIAAESQYQEIENPQYKKAQQELTQLKNKLSKTERDLGKKPATENKDGGLRQNQHREQLNQNCIVIKQNIQKAKIVLEGISKRINLDQIDDVKFKVIDKEGGDLWAICESLFWNSRKELTERIFQYLPDMRDTIPVLEALIKAPGRIQSSANMILVKLEINETPRFKSAQIQLLRYMNNLDCRINGKFLRFDKMSK
jgi:hypothetical protein